MEILTAKGAGFCFGVKKAVDMAYEQIGNDNVYCLGPIIHNKTVCDHLENNNIKIIYDIDNFKNCKIIVRSHGISKHLYDEMYAKNIEIIDGTCPFVKKIHNIVKKSFSIGKKIVIIGDGRHPEVVGINGWCENTAIILNNFLDIDLAISKNLLDECIIYEVVVQTTFKKEELFSILNKLKNLNFKYNLNNTICSSTALRQTEAIKISKVVDKMIVIGDKKSSNTRHLYEICKKNCRNSFYIETFCDLVLKNFNICDRIGITAGASTPLAIIKEVIYKMSELNNLTQENNQEGEELTFQEMLDQSFVSLHTGDIVTGSVIQISNEEISVNLGYKSDGVISRNEYSSDPKVVPSEEVKVGDSIEVLVLRVNDGEGNISLSRRRIEAQKGLDEVEAAYNDKTVVTGDVTELVKKGMIALVNGVRVFIPSSQVSQRYVDDLREFVGKELTFNIIEFDRTKRRIIGSRKLILAKELESKKEEVFGKLTVGGKTTGRVNRLTDFGAFIDLGGIDGLIHISEMSWGKITNPRDILKEGETIEVNVLSIDREKSKISLSLKDADKNPWKDVETKFAVGEKFKGKVVRMVPFGVFVELTEGVDGLVHISQISSKHINKPEDVLKVGEEVTVKVMECSNEQKKISLSIKEADVILESNETATTEA